MVGEPRKVALVVVAHADDLEYNIWLTTATLPIKGRWACPAGNGQSQSPPITIVN